MASSTSSSSTCVIDVSSRTWARETHNLFDFEAKASAITAQSFTARESLTCVRNENEIDVVSHSSSSESTKLDSEKLIQMEWRHGKIYLNRPRWGTSEDRRIQRCWELIRDGDDAASAAHRLAEHDIIKFGRSQFRVRQLSMTPQVVALDDGLLLDAHPAEFEAMSDKVCRICLAGGSTPEDPLLAPCQCKGSIEHVHLGCLKHWVRDRLGLSNGDAAFVVGGPTSQLSCELCKTPYHTRFQMGSKILPLVEVESPFVVLESCNDHRLHVLPVVHGKALKIGRGHECNMNIHDTSISRVQATIELNDSGFELKDPGSRFGTYVKITKPFLLEDGQKVSVQVGRTILKLCAKLADCQSDHTFSQQMAPHGASLQGDDAPDTDINRASDESPRGSGRSAADALERSSPSQEEFLSCDGH
jgi:hypothetical protein